MPARAERPRTAPRPATAHAAGPRRATAWRVERSAIVVGTYPPTQCGLATYTDHLRGAMTTRGWDVGVVRLTQPGDLPPVVPVVANWDRLSGAGLDDAVLTCETTSVVLLQHEYGIYPGADGRDVLDLVHRCAPPIISVLHTVLADPTRSQRAVLDQLMDRSAVVTVHTEVARSRLLGVHGVDPRRVAIVPHGATPNLAGSARTASPTVLTWGLLGPGKGIEHGIAAIARLREAGLDVRYVVAGETHPNVRATEGERYRNGLARQARHAGVGDLVEFDPGYRDWASLRALVRSATLVLLPYDSHDQVTSGVLVEALAAGKPVVATAFPHALEVASTGAALVV
ncbi:MAG: glycosyltransferase, partial [Actinobacteria bacterium]|nr:glycosyltransferase [Actinomycetota bacterium]